MRFRKLFALIPTTLLFIGCVTSPASISLNDSKEISACMVRVTKTVFDKSEIFHGIASGRSLEEAKKNARADLGLMISSSITVVIDSRKRVIHGKNGESDEEITNQIQKLMANNVPLDLHQFENIEQCGALYYVSVVLKKSHLNSSLASRLKNQIRVIKKAVIQVERATSYERYLIRSSLKMELDELDILLVLADRYASSLNHKLAKQWRGKAEQFISDNKELRIRVSASKVALPLLANIEKVLRSAKLDYGMKNYKNAAIEITLGSEQTNTRRGKLYITNLKSGLMVRRTDTGELLAKLSFGQQTSTSQISYNKALGHAQKKMILVIKRQLNGESEYIRKKLGIL